MRIKEIMNHANCFSVQEAAKQLTVQESTLRSWIHQNRIPVIRLGRAVRIKAEVLERILREGLK